MKLIRNVALLAALCAGYFASIGKVQASVLDTCDDAQTLCGDDCYTNWQSCIAVYPVDYCDGISTTCESECFCDKVNCECDNGNETFCPPSSWGC